jgi:hypothetical protein
MSIGRLTGALANWVSAQHAFFYRLIGGLGPFDRNICILTTRGRKTGRQISKPLWYYKQRDRLHVIASHGGSDQTPGLVSQPGRQS